MKANEIKSYEDACLMLGLNPENLPIVDHLPDESDRKSIIAYYKLIVITRALNEGWEPDFSNHNQNKYFVWIWFDAAGFVCVLSSYGPSIASAYVGSRLCFKNRDLANHAKNNFLDLYKDYLIR